MKYLSVVELTNNANTSKGKHYMKENWHLQGPTTAFIKNIN